MSSSPQLRILTATVAVLTLGACVGGGDRYPDLNFRDFERVQGTFSAPAAPAPPRAPAALSAADAASVSAALREAENFHQAFLAQASKARPIVASASGTGIEDNRWPVAQIEIAELESRNGEIMSLLADLDSLYTDASLSFSERTAIEAVREQVGDYHAAERQLIAELIALLRGPVRP